MMKVDSVYVLEFMPTFNKMQNTGHLMCTKFKISGQSILKVIQTFPTVRIVLYIRYSDLEVEDQNKINKLQSTT